jgi:transcriptional regulator with XRE-family HTH domain
VIEAIILIREMMGKSQDDFSKIMKISKTNLAEIELKKSQPYFANFKYHASSGRT